MWCNAVQTNVPQAKMQKIQEMTVYPYLSVISLIADGHTF